MYNGADVGGILNIHINEEDEYVVVNNKNQYVYSDRVFINNSGGSDTNDSIAIKTLAESMANFNDDQDKQHHNHVSNHKFDESNDKTVDVMNLVHAFMFKNK